MKGREMDAQSEIDWTAFYQWKSRQTSQLSLREEAEILETFDNATDPESLEMDSRDFPKREEE